MRLPFFLLSWLLSWSTVALGALSLILGLRSGGRALRGFGLLIGGLLSSLGLGLLYTLRRPNRARIAPALALDSWTVVDDGAHNGFTDLLAWRGSLWLAYISSPSHLSSNQSRLVLLRSADAHEWHEVARFDGGGEDIRDPKLAAVHGHLFLYALLNQKLNPEPYKTVCTRSADGTTWTPLQDAAPEGWLLDRPKTCDGVTWYAPAHRVDYQQAALFRSADGVRWVFHSLIHEGDGADETAIEFLPDGRLLATVRLEMGGLVGHRQAGTLITVATPRFDAWTPLARSLVTRLDGPNLFNHGERVYAVGRYQPHVGGPFLSQGSVLSRKRTSLFLVSPASSRGLVHLSDLPSAGDTAYAGVARHGHRLLISYYSSDPRHDPPWLVGILQPTSIRLASLDLERLEALANQPSRDNT